MTIYLVSLILSVSNPTGRAIAPREGDTITLRYAPKQHSVKARNKWARQNPDLGTEPEPTLKEGFSYEMDPELVKEIKDDCSQW